MTSPQWIEIPSWRNWQKPFIRHTVMRRKPKDKDAPVVMKYIIVGVNFDDDPRPGEDEGNWRKFARLVGPRVAETLLLRTLQWIGDNAALTGIIKVERHMFGPVVLTTRLDAVKPEEGEVVFDALLASGIAQWVRSTSASAAIVPLASETRSDAPAPSGPLSAQASAPQAVPPSGHLYVQTDAQASGLRGGPASVRPSTPQSVHAAGPPAPLRTPQLSALLAAPTSPPAAPHLSDGGTDDGRASRPNARTSASRVRPSPRARSEAVAEAVEGSPLPLSASAAQPSVQRQAASERNGAKPLQLTPQMTAAVRAGCKSLMHARAVPKERRDYAKRVLLALDQGELTEDAADVFVAEVNAYEPAAKAMWATHGMKSRDLRQQRRQRREEVKRS